MNESLHYETAPLSSIATSPLSSITSSPSSISLYLLVECLHLSPIRGSFTISALICRSESFMFLDRKVAIFKFRPMEDVSK